MWTVSNDMLLDIKPTLSDQEALDMATAVTKKAVGEAALIDIHRIRANKMRVIIYVQN
ncbi:hypothetical protein IT408_02080 [Candidatus Uhrbacteria bacterium]|nr:hypothetical protein [Candidatus Uhrbacteria bacterium]